MPLSYNFTGIKKTVIPKALTIPAIVSIKKLVNFNLFKIEPSLLINCNLAGMSPQAMRYKQLRKIESISRQVASFRWTYVI
jgi:hypothetical protein